MPRLIIVAICGSTLLSVPWARLLQNHLAEPPPDAYRGCAQEPSPWRAYSRPACYLVLVDFLRGIGPGIDHVPLAVKDVAITVDLPQHLIVLSFGSGRRSYAKAVNLLHRVQSFLEFFFSPARSQIARRPSHDHNAHA
jgi:hypothetical protein